MELDRQAAEPVISLRNVSKSYAGVGVLHDVSLDIRPGEVIALAGENGAGKSTVLSILTGLVQPTSGELSYQGAPVPAGWSPARARAAGLSSVQQELSLNPQQTVAENIFLGRWPTRWGVATQRDLERAATRLLARVGLDLPPSTPVRRLPLDARQLVELAKALVTQPRVLILDEATSALDDDQVAAVFSVVRELREAGATTIIVTHRLGEMFDISDRIVVLKDGAVVEVRDRHDTTEDQLVQAMLGRSMSEVFAPKADPARGPAGSGLAIRGLSTGGRCHDIDLDVSSGRIVGLGGLQGQGQRDVLRALFGLQTYDGEISLDGNGIRITSPQSAITHHFAYVPEDRKSEGVIVDQSVERNLELPNLRMLAPWRRFGTVSRSRSRALVNELIAGLQIKTTPTQQARRLSGGNQQKVALAKWLPNRPSVLLLAEPTRGIDIGTKREIYRLLREFADDGMAILLTSGDTLELIGLCDEVAVMYEGHIVDILSGDDLTEEKLVHASVVGAHAEVTAS